jgi:hypothetical protein
MNAVDRKVLVSVPPDDARVHVPQPTIGIAPVAPKTAPVWRDKLAKVWQTLAPSLLLLVWDVGCLSAVVAWKQGKSWRFSPQVTSRRSDFNLALDEVLIRLRAEGIRAPRHCYLAARFIAPARVDMPINPEKPRPPLQMREMARTEMEPVIAEIGALWTIGAVLAARGLITPEARERIVLELAVRRGQSNMPINFGQVACELVGISTEDVQESLRLQEKLQMIDASLACGWVGIVGEPGEPPVWLASATGMAQWSQFEHACKRAHLKLLGGLPLAWSVSESERIAAAADTPENSRIALEIHAEEVVAVLRHRGHIVSARVEGRMERRLALDWLLRLVADWRAGGVNTLEIVCLEPRDEAALTALLEDFAHHWGQPPLFRSAAATRHGLLTCLARQHKARTAALPLIRFGELPKPVWTRVGFWHLLLPLLVLAIASGVHIRQRMEIRAIQTKFDLNDFENKRQVSIKQKEAEILNSVKQEKIGLDAARQQLSRLMPEVERLQSIEGMMNHLPRLLRTLAANISDDVVLESVRNSRAGGNLNGIMITGWTNNYGSAQTFALRVQNALSGLGYSVAQTDVRAGAGRNGHPGYFVSFWLIPVAAAEELGQEEVSAAPGVTAAFPHPGPLPEGEGEKHRLDKSSDGDEGLGMSNERTVPNASAGLLPLPPGEGRGEGKPEAEQ